MNIKNYVLAFGLALGSVACGNGLETRVVESEQRMMNVTIVGKKYVKDSAVVPTDNLKPFDFDPLSRRNLLRYSKKYLVTFRFGQEEFTINNKELYEMVDEGSEVEMPYVEKRKRFMRDVDGDGEMEIEKEEHLKYVFFERDARVIKR